jgi:predicted RNase H-like HicB family nuclease
LRQHTMKQKNTIDLIVERSDDGYWVSVKGLPGCYSFGKNISDALKNTYEAIDEHVKGLNESSDKIPEEFLSRDLDFSIQFDMMSLFEAFPVINKTVLANYAGINASLLRQYSKGLAFAGSRQRDKIQQALHRIGKELLQINL